MTFALNPTCALVNDQMFLIGRKSGFNPFFGCCFFRSDMPIYKPSELRAFLTQLGIFPKKKMSQNFLIDGNIIQKILSVAEVKPDDTVLEIGSGPGSLTQALLDAGARVVAVEKDDVLARALERFQTTSQQLTIFCQDILSFPFESEITQRIGMQRKAKVIANLPYHLTTPILTRLASRRELFDSLTLMVQDEFARRMVAKPGTSEYSSLTLFLNFYARVHYAFTVSRNCFYPSPKVNSAVVLLKLVDPPLYGTDVDTFFQMTRTAFEHRRKMLRSSLKSLFAPALIEKGLKAIGESPLARPEVLSLEQFLKLHQFLYHH